MNAESTIETFIASDSYRFGMALFLISEGAFFGFLIIAYVYFHGAVKTGPDAANSLHPLRTGLYTICLLASSFTMWRAEVNHRRDQQRSTFSYWLMATIGLGLLFIFGQAQEYLQLYQSNVTVSRNVFGTSFFTLTGFHGLHVAMGLIALSVLFGLSFKGNVKAPAIRSIALYWHFVDWVWVVIFSVIYLWAYI